MTQARKTSPVHLEDGLTDEEYAELQAIADQHDRKARKDATLNMRISSETLALLKQAAESQGFTKYQRWVEQILADAILKALPDLLAG